MARDLGDLIVRLSLDAAKFEEGMSRFQSQIGKVQSEFKSATTGLTDFDKTTAKLQGSADTLTNRLKMQQDRVAQLEAAYQKSVETKGADAAETQKLAAKLEDARAKLAQTEKALAMVNAEIGKNTNAWYQLSVNMDGVGQKLQDVGKAMSTVGTKLSLTLTAPIVALGTKVVRAGIEFESAFAGVRKTVDASEQTFQNLSDEIKRMSTVIPLSTTELAGIMEMAGQLGVKGEANLKKFTETIAHLGVATNLTREDAASMLAQFANITGMPIDHIDRLGSVVVALGNNFATTESDIVRMGQRLAGAGAQIGLSEAQIMGFAAALSSVGIEAEAGGSAFSKVMIEMQLAVETGSKKLDDFAKVADMSSKEFQTAFKDDAAGAINAFITGLGGMDEQGVSAIKVLDDMGISEVRLRDALLRASGATEVFTGAQELANSAWEENTALTDEAGQRYATTESQLVLLKNAANNLAIQFSEVMMPILRQWIDKLRGVIDWLSSLSTSQMQMIVTIAAVAAAVGPVLLVIGKTTTAIGTVMRVLSPLVSMIGGVNTATGALGAVFTALTGPIGIVVAAVAGLTAVFITLYHTNEEFRAKIDALWASILAALEPVKVMFENTFARMVQAMEPVKQSLAHLWETVQDVFLKLWNFLEPLLITVGLALGAVVTVVIGVVNGIMNAIGPLLEAIVSAVDFVLNIFGALIAFLSGDFAGAWASLKAAISSLWDVVVNVFTAIGAFWTGFWQGIVTFVGGFGIDLGAAFSAIWSAISTGVSTAWTAIGAWLTSAWEGIKATATTVWTGVTTAINTAVATCKTGIETAWNAASAWLGSTWDGISSTASSTWDTIKSNISSAVDACKSSIENAWNAAKTSLSNTWSSIKSAATTTWNGITSTIDSAVATGKANLLSAWDAASTAVQNVWNTLKTTATTTWNALCTNVTGAINSAKAGIQTAWASISTAISAVWTSLKTSAATAWSGITGAVSSAITGAKSGIVNGWESIKNGVSTTWNKVLDVIKTPITSAQTWLQEKVNFFKGLFNFTWKLPEFKLPKIEVSWNDIGWGVSIPSLSLKWNALGGIFRTPTIFGTANAGLQGVGEAGPEAILPLDTLWEEMSARLKAGMREILADMKREEAARESMLARTVAAALGVGRQSSPSVNVTQNIYAEDTSYAGQQREAARNFRQIARALG